MERELIEKCKNGDMESFNQLIELYQRRVFAVSFNMMGNEQDAYDASQEVFLKIYRSIGSFHGESAFFTWVYRMTKNVCLDMLRKRKASVSLSPDEDGAVVQLEAQEGNPGEHAEKNQMRQAVRKAIGELPDDLKTALVLRDIEGLRYDEIAQATGANLGTVKSRIARARAQLKKILQGKKELFDDFCV